MFLFISLVFPLNKRQYINSKKFKFKIIEDASHSLGAKYKKEQVGSCKWSDISVFSFHPVKIITTFEGGAATTNSKIIYEKLKLFLNHGITKEKKNLSSKKIKVGIMSNNFWG